MGVYKIFDQNKRKQANKIKNGEQLTYRLDNTKNENPHPDLWFVFVCASVFLSVNSPLVNESVVVICHKTVGYRIQCPSQIVFEQKSNCSVKQYQHNLASTEQLQTSIKDVFVLSS